MQLRKNPLFEDVYEPMSKEEERTLFAELRGVDDMKLNETLIRRNARLAMKVATWASSLNRDSTLDIEDYLQIALTSMLKAISRFDTERNVRFATFAYRTMRLDIVEFWGNRGKYVDSRLSVSLDDNGKDGCEIPMKDRLSTCARIVDDQKAGLILFSTEVAKSDKIAPLAKKLLMSIAKICMVDGESKSFYSRERAAKLLGLSRGYCLSQFGESTMTDIRRIIDKTFSSSVGWPSGGGADKTTQMKKT